MNEPITLTGLSNREFLTRYARAGRIGLVGGSSFIDKAIGFVERHVDEERRPSPWSHAFFFQGERADGHHWLIESDLVIERKHIRLGVQENRISKFFDEEMYTTVAILDFDLSPGQVEILVREGLELVASRSRYSLRELAGTVFALRHPQFRERRNLLARDNSFFCSALVRHLFSKARLDLCPGLDIKNTTPEDLLRTTLPHTTYWLRKSEEKTAEPGNPLSRALKKGIRHVRSSRLRIHNRLRKRKKPSP